MDQETARKGGEAPLSEIMAPSIGEVTGWQAAGLDEAEREALNELLRVWAARYARNSERMRYYEMDARLKDLGIAIPPALRRMRMAMGWPAKAVDYLADRSIFDGFRVAAGDEGLVREICEGNDLRGLYRALLPSELAMSPAFVTATAGGPGEPAAVISGYDARTAAALWDWRRRRIRCGLTIVDFDVRDGYPRPTQMNLYTDRAVVELTRSRNGRYSTRRIEHGHGRPLMEALRYRPTLSRPFGRTRIGPAVRSITDCAIRECYRSEVAAEFAAAPQKYVMGADDSTFSDGKWSAYMGAIMALSVNEEGENPVFGQLPQMSMQPHVDYFRHLAAQFAGETGVPISSLGVVHDNPASAEAIYAAKEDIVVEATCLNETNGVALANVARMAVAVARGIPLPEAARELDVRARWRNPSMPSAVSQSDAMVKQIGALPWLAQSDIALEELGYPEEKIAQLREDRERAGSRAVLDAVRAQLALDAAGGADA